MKIFTTLYQHVVRLSAHPHAPWYLGGVSIAESSFFPIPPDVMLMPMSLARPDRALFFALLTTLCSVLGGVLGYLIGYFAYESIEPWLVASYGHELEIITGWYDTWGVWVVFLAGFSPVPYKIFTIASGMLGMALLPFVVASLVGRGARFFLVAFLSARLGPAVQAHLQRYMEGIGWTVVALSVALYLSL